MPHSRAGAITAMDGSLLSRLPGECLVPVLDGLESTLKGLLGVDLSSSGSSGSTQEDGSGCVLLLFCRAGAAPGTHAVSYDDLSKELDPGLTALMIPTLSTSSNTHQEGVS